MNRANGTEKTLQRTESPDDKTGFKIVLFQNFFRAKNGRAQPRSVLIGPL
jgi:hypothetical protein